MLATLIHFYLSELYVELTRALSLFTLVHGKLTGKAAIVKIFKYGLCSCAQTNKGSFLHETFQEFHQDESDISSRFVNYAASAAHTSSV